jgi:hypothetical protein
MERLTRPNLNVDQDTDRFLHAAIGGKEIDWKQSRDSTLNVLINGPTSNGFGKDIFRKMARDLYGRLKAYEDTGWTPEMLRKMGENAGHLWDFAQAAENMTVGRLKELAEADKDGRVVVLPCKVGQRVFALLDTDKHISECEVKQIGMGNEIGFIGLEPIGARGREYGVALNGFGKTVFLTREAAEKALEGIKDGY